MASDAQSFRKYGDADGYDAYMGGWSAALAQPFIAFAGVGPSDRILDIGCGTGNLLAAARSALPGTRLTGIDPSPTLLEKARQRHDLADAVLVEGKVEALPFGDASFDSVLSLLVLQEFRERTTALAEMRRVTRAGGGVAACQWDFARMPVIDGLMRAIAAVDPAAAKRINLTSPAVFNDEDELRDCWELAGFGEVVAGRITVTQRFEDFDALWRPLTRGATPSTLTLGSMPTDQQRAVRAMLEREFVRDDGKLTVIAEALVIRGRAG